MVTIGCIPLWRFAVISPSNIFIASEKRSFIFCSTCAAYASIFASSRSSIISRSDASPSSFPFSPPDFSISFYVASSFSRRAIFSSWRSFTSFSRAVTRSPISPTIIYPSRFLYSPTSAKRCVCSLRFSFSSYWAFRRPRHSAYSSRPSLLSFASWLTAATQFCSNSR